MMTEQDVAKVAAFADVNVRTVRRALESTGRQTRSSVTRMAICLALRKLGFRLEAARIEREATKANEARFLARQRKARAQCK